MLKLYFAQQLCANPSHSRGLNTCTAMLRISKVKLCLSALTTSDVRLAHIQLIADGIKCHVLEGEKKQTIFFPTLCISLRRTSAVCCYGDDVTRPTR